MLVSTQHKLKEDESCSGSDLLSLLKVLELAAKANLPLDDLIKFRDTCLAMDQHMRSILCPALKLEPASAWFAENPAVELWITIYKWLETYVDAENRDLERVKISFSNSKTFDMLSLKNRFAEALPMLKKKPTLRVMRNLNLVLVRSI